MNFRKKGAQLFAFVFVFLIACGVAFAEKAPRPEIESLLRWYNQGPVEQTCQGSVEDHSGVVLRYFDANCFSSPKTKILIVLTRSKTGEPEIETVVQEGTDSDLFYCEQAIWDSTPLPVAVPAKKEKFCACYFRKNWSLGTFPELISNDGSKSVFLHLIPVYAENRYGISSKLIRDKSNVVELKTDRLQDPRLDAFRREWAEFFRTHPTLDLPALTTYAASLKVKYSGLFEKS